MSQQKTAEITDNKELYIKTIRFFQQHGPELDHIRQLLEIRLTQLALAYTTENRVPPESIVIKTRVKTFDSFLKKMEALNRTDFEFPSDILYDLIGARVVCWFLDDCKGFTRCIRNSNFISVDKNSIFNYIKEPKPSGYRGIHLHARIAYESMTASNCEVKPIHHKILCEIQVRTKLMDVFADLTHEFHYKSKGLGVEYEHLERVLESQAKRFFSEDESFIAIRNLYQKMLMQK
jgi:putative GTP pyrophosphokinase